MRTGSWRKIGVYEPDLTIFILFIWKFLSYKVWRFCDESGLKSHARDMVVLAYVLCWVGFALNESMFAELVWL